MIIFYVILVLGLGGIGFVLWNLKTETDSQKVSVEKFEPEQLGSFNLKDTFLPTSSDRTSPSKPANSIKEKSKISFSLNSLTKSFSDISKKIKLPSLKENKTFEPTFNTPISTKDKLATNPFNTPNVKTGNPFGTQTAQTQPVSPQTVSRQLNPEEVRKIESEIDLTTQFNELKDRYGRLEKILNEKTTEFDKVQESLIHEQKNRKEFNKIKDLLEKEIKDAKDQVKEAQSQFNLSKTEAEVYKKRITQLEEKATKLEKEILKKEEEVDTLVKRLQTFASPTTAATPPKKEPIKEEPAKIESEPAMLNLETPPPAVSAIATTLNEPTLNPPGTPNTDKAINTAEPKNETILPVLDLTAESPKTISPQDLNLQPPSPSTEQIKNIVDILSSPEETILPLDEQSSPSQKSSSEETPYLKLNPDIASTDEPPKDKPQT